MLILATLLTILVVTDASFPRVTIKDGIVEGHFLKTIKGRGIAAFEGIPYAKPPVGKLRFEPPEPNDPWIGVWSAKSVHPCLQYDHSKPAGEILIKGDEDCLYVNVYAPQKKISNADVIVYIHGGAFMFNYGGLHRPGYILDRDVIFVTLNYRLGPLGFLSTEDNIVPGNNGLKDQNLALKWVKENIHHFGGNPDSITLVGMSAGGASVHFHTLSTSSKGLFHKVIAQSGVGLNPWSLNEHSREKAFKLGTLLGCPTDDSKDLVDCLKTRPGQQIVNAVQHFQVWLYIPFTPFGPVIDKWSDNPFIPEHPLQTIKNKMIADVPTIFSFVQCEGLYPAADFIADPENLKKLNSKWNDLLPHILDYNYTIPTNKQNEISEMIREEYFGNEDITMDTFYNVIDMMSDRIFLKNINEVAQLHATSIQSPVYLYKFSYLGAYSQADSRAAGRKVKCAAHADDTTYIIPNKNIMRSNEFDEKMSDALIDIWVTFAKLGYPVVEGIEWTPLPEKKSKTLHYLNLIGPTDFVMETVENLGKPQFWNTIPFKENENLFTIKDEL